MSRPSETPWSNGLYAPQIPSWLYLAEKDWFAGYFIGVIFYGVVVALFFQCMGALLSPINPIRRGIKWALVTHTAALFLVLTIPVWADLNHLSIAYINNREYPGNDGSTPGPIGYDFTLNSKATTIISRVMFPLNQWLADGLLLHRCYIIYSMDHWVMVFPYLMYLASIAMGIANVYQSSGMGFYSATTTKITTAYYSICLSLNIFLTLMIVTHLIVHIRNLKAVIGASDGSSGLRTVVMMLIESYALYAVALLLFIIPWAVSSPAVALFSKVVGTIQVIAPYLIILRVAKRRAVASETISGTGESIRFRSHGSTDDDEPVPDGEPVNLTEVNGEAAGEIIARDENAIEEAPL